MTKNRKKTPAKTKSRSTGAFRQFEERAVASYAAARPNSDTARSWARGVIPETPMQALTPQARADIRQQARDMAQNSPHAAGIANLFALYVVGTAPRLRFIGFEKWRGRELERVKIDYVEHQWDVFSVATRFPAVLRNAMKAIVVDGEAFVLTRKNPKIKQGFDLYLIDSRRVGNANATPSTRLYQDGLEFDEYGNVESFTIYDPPENAACSYMPSKYQKVAPEQCFHLFRQDFAEQTRGVSWFAPCLRILQQLNEYTAASIEAAKQSTRVWATIETTDGFEQAAESDMIDPQYGAPYDVFRQLETPNGRILTLPPGTTARGFNATQPNTAADSYTANLLAQIGYALGLPRNKATGSSHEYNFASGRLDNQPFELLIGTLQRDLFERDLCDRAFAKFYEMTRYDAPLDLPTVDEAEWEWVWPNPPLIDAESTARTASIELKSGQRSMREVWERVHPGGNFEAFCEEYAEERARFPEVFGVSATEEIEEETPATRINEPKSNEATTAENAMGF